MKTPESQAVAMVHELLAQIPVIRLGEIEPEPGRNGVRIDFLAHVQHGRKSHALACEVKSSGQPKVVRHAINQLTAFSNNQRLAITPIVIAPYLSPDAQALCRAHNVGYLDFEGNVLLQWDGIYIERQVATRPAVERRELRSLFKPKAAQILRTMMREPQRPWRVTELAQHAGVSLGQVSNVRSALLSREWACVNDAGLYLADPDALLDEWVMNYQQPAGERLDFYTTLHGRSLESALHQLLSVDAEQGRAVLASFSAAQWLAPYGRTGMHYFYADSSGLEQLRAGLNLQPTTKGANVRVFVLKEPGLFQDVQEPISQLICTSPVQTYLDLTAAGERGNESADYLRQKLLIWKQ